MLVGDGGTPRPRGLRNRLARYDSMVPNPSVFRDSVQVKPQPPVPRIDAA
jgi:hypothetical protein